MKSESGVLYLGNGGFEDGHSCEEFKNPKLIEKSMKIEHFWRLTITDSEVAFQAFDKNSKEKVGAERVQRLVDYS